MVRDGVGRRGFRIEGQAEVLAEGAEAVPAGTHGHEEAVIPSELLLGEESATGGPDPSLVGLGVGSRFHELVSGSREILAEAVHAPAELVVVLGSPGQVGGEVEDRQVRGPGAGVVHGDVSIELQIACAVPLGRVEEPPGPLFGVVCTGVVQPNVQPVVHGRRGSPLELEAGDEVVDLLPKSHVQDQRVVMSGGVIVLPPHDVQDETLGVVSVGDEGDIPAGEHVAGSDEEVVERFEPEIPPDTHVRGPSRFDVPPLITDVCRKEIRHVRTALYLEVVVLDVALPEPGPAGGAARIHGAVVHVEPGGVLFRTHMPDVGEALGGGERPPGSATPAVLGEDLDHAAGSLGAVEGRGCGALDDLDAFDGAGVQVVEGAGLGVGFAGAPIEAHFHPDTVHVDEGPVPGGPTQGVHTPEHDFGSASGVAAHARDGQSSGLALEHVGHGGDGLGFDSVAADDTHRVPDLTPPGGTGRSGDHDLVQGDGLGSQLEIRDHRFSGGDSDLRGRGSVAQPRDLEGLGAHRNVEDQVPALWIGDGADLGSCHQDLGSGEGLARRGADDAARNLSGSLGRQGKCCEE